MYGARELRESPWEATLSLSQMGIPIQAHTETSHRRITKPGDGRWKKEGEKPRKVAGKRRESGGLAAAESRGMANPKLTPKAANPLSHIGFPYRTAYLGCSYGVSLSLPLSLSRSISLSLSGQDCLALFLAWRGALAIHMYIVLGYPKST